MNGEANAKLWVEVSVGVYRKTPPEVIRFSELDRWQKQHQVSKKGLFCSVYRYPTQDPYIGGVISDFYVDLDCEEDPDNARKSLFSTIRCY